MADYKPRYSTKVYKTLKDKMRAYNLYATASILYHYGQLSSCANFDNPHMDSEKAHEQLGGLTEWKYYLSIPENNNLYQFRKSMLKANSENMLTVFKKNNPLRDVPWHPDINKPIPNVKDEAQPYRFLGGHSGTFKSNAGPNLTDTYFADDAEFNKDVPDESQQQQEPEPEPEPEPTPAPAAGVKRKFNVPRTDVGCESSIGDKIIPPAVDPYARGPCPYCRATCYDVPPYHSVCFNEDCDLYLK